ncbi:hypothetical protein GCM10009836_67480 [Pseudonocardia ailaonensis]|uniref:histidine kinase n=1 Tax=Pseudonocardia ailaonensis TaxID=367279 RepID=A0ABN2NNA0_9PSEU
MILEPGRPTPLRSAATLAWLPVILVASFLSQPRLPFTVLVIGGAVLASLGWVVLSAKPERPGWLLPAGLVTLSAGGCLMVAQAREWVTPIAFCFVAVVTAGTRLRWTWALALTLATIAALIPAVAPREPSGALLLGLAMVTVLMLGMARRDRFRRAEERELAEASETRATEEHARAAALAERARIARDVHDVLAHSLSALAVQLQGARLMLQRDGAAADTIAQVERAQRLATEGLAEARRAIHALRSGPIDLPSGLAALAADHPGATLDVAADLPELTPEARETVVRTAQEALSNARKHAPGAPVRIRLARAGEGARLEVTDVTGARPEPGTGGYGLVGMAERAALVGARLDAGPTEDGWRVSLTIP